MLFAREHVFFDSSPLSPPRQERQLTSGDLIIHVKLDSTPRFKKDIIVAERDHYRTPDAPPVGVTHLDLFLSFEIRTRMHLVQQMGTRAVKFPLKLKRLRHMRALDSSEA